VSAPARFEFVEGATSDLSFVARGSTLEEAFAAAAEALLAATLEAPARVEARLRREIALEEPDLELLLLRFLNELVYLRDAEGLLLRAERLRVSPGPPARLDATLAGEEIDAARHALAAEVKAATAHGLGVRRDPAGWRAEATLDV
jgi:SHS2 domain-containing protein